MVVALLDLVVMSSFFLSRLVHDVHSGGSDRAHPCVPGIVVLSGVVCRVCRVVAKLEFTMHW